MRFHIHFSSLVVGSLMIGLLLLINARPRDVTSNSEGSNPQLIYAEATGWPKTIKQKRIFSKDYADQMSFLLEGARLLPDGGRVRDVPRSGLTYQIGADGRFVTVWSDPDYFQSMVLNILSCFAVVVLLLLIAELIVSKFQLKHDLNKRTLPEALPFILTGLGITPILIAIAVFFALGKGNAAGIFIRLFFPITMAISFALQSQTCVYILALLQFPLYGLIIGMAPNRFARAILIVLIHLCATVIVAAAI